MASGVLGPDSAFRRWASQTPDQIAIRWGPESWTYGQLDSAVDRLAAVLRHRGCRPGQRITLLFDPGASRVAAMLAALRAGAAYIPLDPGWPDTRIQWVHDDVSPALSLVAPPLAARARTLGLSNPLPWALGSEEMGPAAKQHRAGSAARPRELAYILYTSGSTGRPKGVMQSGVNVLDHARAYAQALRLSPRDRLSQIAPYTFDASVMDIYGALAHGATLCVLDPRPDGLAKLPETLARHQVTVLHLTPTLYRFLLAGLEPDGLPTLRTVVLGGEEVTRQDLADHRRVLGSGVELINAFGPTECTTALWHVVDLDRPWPLLRVPLGKPLPGIEVELAAQALRSGDEPGEIVLHSSRVALGYWRRPAESRRSFPAPGVYRTGDLAMRRGDGLLVYRGRRDGQFKIRGQRVEAGEIEDVLRMVPGVARAAVVVSRQTPQRLVAFLQPQPQPQPGARRDGQALRSRARRLLTRTLPRALIPHSLVVLESLPLTTSGKIDRARLSHPKLSHWPPPKPSTRGAPVASDPLRQTLATLWAEVLACPMPGADDHFFEIGGDSLEVARVVRRAERALGIRLPAESLYRQPTLDGFAREVEAVLETHSRPSSEPAPLLPEVRPAAAPRHEPIENRQPLSAVQRRYWARLQAEPDTPAFNVTLAIRWEGPMVLRALESALDSVVQRHATFRTSFSLEEDPPWLEIAEAVGSPAVPLPWIDLQALAPAEIAPRIQTLGRALATRPFDLGSAPLLRGALVDDRRGTTVLLLSWHHLVLDGWSRLRFEDELFTLYDRHRRGCREAEPPALTTASSSPPGPSLETPPSPTDSRRWLPPDLRLPAPPPPRDHPAKGGCGPAACCTRSLPERSRSRLQGLFLEARMSPFVVFASAFSVFLGRWTEAHDIVVTTDVARWPSPTAERALGLSADVLVLPVEVTPNRSLVDVGTAIRQRVLAADEASATGEPSPAFADLLEARLPGTLGEYERLFPYAVFLEPAPHPVRRPGGILTESREVSQPWTTRDLMLVVTEGEDFELSLVYRADAYRATTMEEWTDRLLGLCQRLLQDPHQPVGSCPV